MQAFNPRTLEGRCRWISESKDCLVYRVSSRTARATQRNPVLKTKPKIKKNKKQKTKKEFQGVSAFLSLSCTKTEEIATVA